MKKFYLFTLLVAVAISVVVISCGSRWSIQGNNMYINKLDKDTIVPAGSYVITEDTLFS